MKKRKKGKEKEFCIFPGFPTSPPILSNLPALTIYFILVPFLAHKETTVPLNAAELLGRKATQVLSPTFTVTSAIYCYPVYEFFF